MAQAKVKFKRLSYNAYRLIQQPDVDTLYFILDKPFIYLGKVQYGLILDAQKHLITSVAFDNETNELVLGISGSDTPERVPFNINAATEGNDGLMTSTQVKQLNKHETKILEHEKQLTNIDETIKEVVNEVVAEATIDPIWNEVT